MTPPKLSALPSQFLLSISLFGTLGTPDTRSKPGLAATIFSKVVSTTPLAIVAILPLSDGHEISRA